MNILPNHIRDLIYEYTNEKNIIKKYYKQNILTKIDPSLYKIKYDCFACYYRNFLLNNNSNNCLFGNHIIKKEKWYSCHLLPIYNPNGELLKLYEIVNNNIELFLIIYQNKVQREILILDLYNFHLSKN